MLWGVTHVNALTGSDSKAIFTNEDTGDSVSAYDVKTTVELTQSGNDVIAEGSDGKSIPYFVRVCDCCIAEWLRRSL